METYEAVVKFIAANVKKSSGWKAIVNGQEERVKMEDESFIERLSNMQEPHIFGKSFTVSLKAIKVSRLNSEKIKYAITRVHHETYST